jgi:Holliday junction resolvasome RuvABC DNA-binding subunit
VENLITLCAAHHEAHHDGKLRIRGARADHVVFEHADRRRYGEDDPLVTSKAALCELGFSPKEAARAVNEVRRTLPPDHRGDLEEVLRACLRATVKPTG